MENKANATRALDLMDIGWWTYSRCSGVFECSKAIHRLFLLPYDIEIDFADLTNLIPDRDNLLESLELLDDEYRFFEKELTALTSEGKNIWLKVSIELLNHEKQLYLGVMKDITKEKILAESRITLMNEQIRYKNTVGKLAIIAETDLRGTITFVNDKFCEVTGYKKHELIGKTHRLVNSGYHPKDFFKQMWETLLSGEVWQGRICNARKDESVYWVQTNIAPIYRDNKITGFFSMRIEITNQVALEEEIEIEKERGRFNAQLASVGEMSASIAHEIANPLAIINGANNLIVKMVDKPDKILLHADSVKNAVQRIQKIITGLKRLARKSTGDDFELTKLDDIVVETMDFLEESLRHTHITLEVSKIPQGVFLMCRDVEISQVLVNLVRNSRDSIIENNCKERWIKVHISLNENQIVVSVVDSGPGISKDIQNKIMESFFTTKKTGKGTGLGLSLVKKIIESHKGKISLLPDEENTTFEITLPRHIVD